MVDLLAEFRDGLPTFCIVTPVFNGREYIDETISSILNQVGNFNVHYHVQDGGSTDGTLERVAYWQELAKILPSALAKLTFTCASEPDNGMYDAINKGFAHALPPGDDVVMGWIAADDKIAPGGFAAISGIRRTFPEIRFLGGRVSLLDETGSIIAVHALQPFNRRCMAAGLNDGRTMPFIMQEGTFWCADLWRKVGGLNSSMRLAGDWDLWRRMAWHEEYFVADSVFGFHRRRPGQLSEHMDRYYAEVDKALEAPVQGLPKVLLDDDITHELSRNMPDWRSVGAIVERQHQMLLSRLTRFRESAHATTFLKYNLAFRDWEKPLRTGDVSLPETIVEQSGIGIEAPVRLLEGFGASEGPYPEFGMRRTIRWIIAPSAFGAFEAPSTGRYSIRLSCRNWDADRSVTIRCDGRPVSWLNVPQLGHDSDIKLQAEVTLAAGPHSLEVAIDGATGPGSYLLVETWTVALLPVRRSRALVPVYPRSPGWPEGAAGQMGPALPRISIVVPTRNQAHFIRDTLASLVRQNYPNLEVVVVDGASTDETLAIVDEFAAHVSVVISEPDKGQSNAINKGLRKATGEVLSWLNSDDLLADGALFAVAQAFMTSTSEIVVGGCRVFGRENRVLHEHWPCISGGELEAAAILDIENAWLRGKFFHQPEVFFSRSLWDRAGGYVDEDLYYSMDFDLWVRMGWLSPQVSVIGSVVACFRMHDEQKTSTVEAYRPELTKQASTWRQQLGLAPLPEALELKRSLRITFFNDVGFKYGAGIAHRRLAMAALAAGHEVTALAYADLDRGRPEQELSDSDIAAAIIGTRPDLVIVGNLHAIRADCNLLQELADEGVPTVFYAHDHWIATGRCAYPGACDRHLQQCDASCPTADIYPALPSRRVAEAFEQRRKSISPYGQQRFAIATNSSYMARSLDRSLGERAQPVRFLPLGIDVSVFAPKQRWRARQIFDLPQDRFIIATSATSLADPRKDTRILLEAIGGLPELDKVMLLVMGFGEPITGLPFETRFIGFVTEELLVASYLNATDLFVATSREEAFGQTIVEAAACGIPAVAFDTGGIGETIIDDVTGLLLRERSVEALASAIGKLRSDAAARERFGASARVHAVNRFSREASAAALIGWLAGNEELNLALAPTVVIAPEPPVEIKGEYLVSRPETEIAVVPEDWLPATGFTHELGTPDNGVFTQFWWAAHPTCRFFVRSKAAGSHLIEMALQCALEDQEITLRVNGGPPVTAPVPAAPFTDVRSVAIPVDLRAGYNRIDMDFREAHRFEADKRSLGVLVRSIEISEDRFAGQATPHDGAFKLGAGFGPEEGPYADAGLDCLFRWVVGRRAQLRFYSASTGPRAVRLHIRSHLYHQQLVFYIDGVLTNSRSFRAGNTATPLVVTIGAELSEGFHTLEIVASNVSDPGSGEASLAWLFEDLELGDEEASPINRTMVRWDLSSGIGPQQPSLPLEGFDRPFRLLYGKQVSIVIEHQRGGEARLSFEYRLPNVSVSALMAMNGAPSGRVDFGIGSLIETKRVSLLVRLLPGENVIDLDLKLGFGSPDESFTMLLEQLTVDDDFGAVDPVPVAVDRGFRWVAEEGFSYREGDAPESGITEGFRWCTAPEGRVRFDRVVNHLTLYIRNVLPGQQLTFLAGAGTSAVVPCLGSIALEADVTRLVEVDLSAETAFDSLVISCSKVPPASPGDERSLCFMLAGVRGG